MACEDNFPWVQHLGDIGGDLADIGAYRFNYFFGKPLGSCRKRGFVVETTCIEFILERFVLRGWDVQWRWKVIKEIAWEIGGLRWFFGCIVGFDDMVFQSALGEWKSGFASRTTDLSTVWQSDSFG